MSLVTLTISIPAYNDAETIAKVVQESMAAAAQVTFAFEVLVINDGSADDTDARVKDLVERYPNVRYHLHPKNLGFGPTIGEAYTLPRSEWVYFVPGDGQDPPSGLVNLFANAHEADLILAYRKDRQDTSWRRFVSGVYNGLVSMVAGRRIRDVNAAGLLRRSALDQVQLRSNSAFVHAEILLEVLRHGGRVLEVPAEHRPREHGTGSGNKWRVILHCFRDLVLYSLDRRLGIPVWGRP